MTISDFDPRTLFLYDKPKYLLHFQWQNSSIGYRSALVEIVKPGAINHRLKQKDDEIGLTQKEIWEKKYA